MILQLQYKNTVREIDIAQSWNDLTRDQLLYIAARWQTWKEAQKKGKSMINAKCGLFFRLAPVMVRYKNQIMKSFTDEQLYELADLSSFIFEKNDLTKCPVPSFGRFIKLHSPADKLSGIIALEFAFADDAFLKYTESGKPEDLQSLIGALYRPRRWFSTDRVKFNKNRIERHARAASKLPYAVQQSILLWYTGCRYALTQRNQDLFSKQNEGKARAGGWLNLILALSGSKFGTFEQTAHESFHLILMELREAKERNKPNPKATE